VSGGPSPGGPKVRSAGEPGHGAVRVPFAAIAARAAASKTEMPTVVLDIGDLLGITDAFVITSGTNVRQVRTIAEEVEKQVAEAGGGKPRRIEGRDDLQWVLLDYGDFVVHVFLDEVRRVYDLERLWSDAPVLEWRELVDSGTRVV
jgi:ribosome-associated protein